MHYLLLFQYLSHWLLLYFREYNAAFLCHCWVLFILWWDSWYANMNLSEKKTVQSLWYSGPWASCFHISSKFFCYFVIISLWKEISILCTQERFVPSWVEIGPPILEKQTKMWRVKDNRSAKLNSVMKIMNFVSLACCMSLMHKIVPNYK